MAQRMRAATPARDSLITRGGQVPALDGLRAVASLMVLTTHVAFHCAVVLRPVVGPLTSRLDFGVCLFFFLSGFLLYRPWARAAIMGSRRPANGQYLRKRFARVYPAYAVVVVVVLAFYPPSQTRDLDVWARYLSLTQVYASGYERQGLTQMWSLAMEVAFYLMLPVLGWWVTRRRPGIDPIRRNLVLLWAMVLVALLFNAVRGWGEVLPPDLAGYWLPTHLDWFAGGMLLAVVEVAGVTGVPAPRWFAQLRTLARDWASWLVIATLLFALALTPLAGPLTPFDTITSYSTGPWYLILKEFLYGGCALALMVPLTLGGRDHPYARVLAHPAARWVGGISYGIFLWHLVLLGWISSALGIATFTGWFWVLWPLTVAATVAVSWVSWHLLERRWIAWSVRPRN